MSELIIDKSSCSAKFFKEYLVYYVKIAPI